MSCDASRDPIIDMQYVPGDSFSRVGGLKKKPSQDYKNKTLNPKWGTWEHCPVTK